MTAVLAAAVAPLVPTRPLVRQHDGSAALSRHDCRPSARRAASENKDVGREDEAFRLRRHAFGAR